MQQARLVVVSAGSAAEGSADGGAANGSKGVDLDTDLMRLAAGGSAQ
jgi:hypothetical protein